MNPKVYIETTIISYLTAWRSPQLVMAANQETTRNWWDDERLNFDLFISEAVIQEASAGDPDAARKRLKVRGHSGSARTSHHGRSSVVGQGVDRTNPVA